MHITDGRLTLAGHDLGRFLSCRHLTALDMEVAFELRPKPPVYDDPALELLKERGLAHEKQHNELLVANGLAVLDLSAYKFEASVGPCLDAMRRGEPAIAQGGLAADGWIGYPDLLMRVEALSKFGSWSYEAYDTKLARETRGTTILQLSLYTDLLAGLQGTTPERFHVVTPAGTESYRTADFAAYYRLVKRHLEETTRHDPKTLAGETYPEPVDYCSICRWSPLCDKRRRADDHLSFVANISRLQRQEFDGHGVTTLERLGDLGAPLPFTPSRGSREAFEKSQAQARIQLEGRRKDANVHELLLPVEEGRGLALLPEPSPGDAFLDLEGDHFAAEGGREYLFGLTVLGADGQTRHVKRWGHDEGEEKKAFESIMDEILSLQAANPRMHVYHFAPYEPAAFKRLMARHASRVAELDRMLRAELFVDLCAVVRQGLRASVESYSIKDLERFYGFARKTSLREAGNARRSVEMALELGDPGMITPEIRELVANYNEEDCVSALELRRWLEALRKDHEKNGVTVPRPPLKDGAASEEAEQRGAEVQAAMDALLQGVPAEKKDRTSERQARWLLAHMLEFHRREDKVAWWEFYRLCDLVEEDELLAERAVVTGLKFVSRTPPSGRGKVPTDRYQFPLQEFQGRKNDDLKTQDGVKWGTIAAIDAAGGRLEVTKTKARMDEHPRVAFAHKHIRPEPIPTALMSLAREIIDHGIVNPSRPSVAREILLANPPRLAGEPFAPRPGESPRDFAIRAVLVLDRSVLPVQGPPGAGKTYTGARMIVECARRGMKVGVSAVGHKVIKKLLEDAVAEAKKEGVPLRCAHKDKKDEPIADGIDEVSDSANAFAALRDGSVQVISGTAWHWSHRDAPGAVDILFVDEAGQASLANVLAMSLAAKSIVLLGDPLQLEQPQRGTHPEGVDASALEHMLAGHQTIPLDRGIFLDKTWRLPPAICAFTSELFYEGRLESQPEAAAQRLAGAAPYEGAGLWFDPVEHDGNTNSSPEEVRAVVSIASKLLAQGSIWTNDKGELKPVTAADILVVSPFNAQVNLLQQALEPFRIHVGTVDRFQGQEAAIVIYSMATSRPEDAPRGMEFLYDLNRLNVATSRARCACILVASPRLFEPDCKTPRQMRLANAMCRYAEQAWPAAPSSNPDSNRSPRPPGPAQA